MHHWFHIEPLTSPCEASEQCDRVKGETDSVVTVTNVAQLQMKTEFVKTCACLYCHNHIVHAPKTLLSYFNVTGL